ncbi:MAG: hypothetical protein B1H13_14035 [Desulfobacteraceae bacterium 4484_190.3]|nr:MAG: hypothetical protein B1H13_14035 [Desulfobacteraceae bacterium 4484_190.3]
MKKLPRKTREFLRHRAEILDVALELFSEKGFHNVTMQEISRKSEFSVGTLYKFFPNKEELYRALFLEKAEEFNLAGKSIERSWKSCREFSREALKRASLRTLTRIF